MTSIINGKLIAEKITARNVLRARKLKKRGVYPKLAVVCVGEHAPSQTYIRKKREAAEKTGIDFMLHRFSASVSKPALINGIKKIQQKEKPSGIIIQLPLPEKFYRPEILNTVSPNIDVDSLTDANLGRLVMETHHILPPTPAAVLEILRHIGVSVRGKNITLVGAGALVGKPLAIILVNEGATVTVCNSDTKNLKARCLNADILITGVGKKDLIRGHMIKKGAIVIDTGISYIGGEMFGDVNQSEARGRAQYLTPVPGGVGPVTVALLIQNTLICAERNGR